MNIILTEHKCEACEGGIPPLTPTEVTELLTQTPRWTVSDDNKVLHRQYVFANFREALAFINQVGELAEAEGHHPDIHFTNYKHVAIDLTTHAIGGLSKNDFIVAAKIDGGR